MANNHGYTPLAPAPPALDPHVVQNIVQKADAGLNHVLNTAPAPPPPQCQCTCPPTLGDLSGWDHAFALLVAVLRGMGRLVYWLMFEADWISGLLNVMLLLAIIGLLFVAYRIAMWAIGLLFSAREASAAAAAPLPPPQTTGVYRNPNNMYATVVMVPGGKPATSSRK